MDSSFWNETLSNILELLQLIFAQVIINGGIVQYNKLYIQNFK